MAEFWTVMWMTSDKSLMVFFLFFYLLPNPDRTTASSQHRADFKLWPQNAPNLIDLNGTCLKNDEP